MDETTKPGQSPIISVVVPLLNEQDNLGELYMQITNALHDGDPYEVIFVDDGSTDRSFEILSDFHQKDPHVRVIRFRKNFGQTAAMSAGFNPCPG